VAVRRLEEGDRAWARGLVADTWGVPVVSPSGVYDDPAVLEGFVAEHDGRPVGLLLHRIFDGRCEVVALVVQEEGRGHGRALMEAAREVSRDEGCDHLWLITTDENPRAIAFYKSLGMTEGRRHLDFVDVVRRSKPDSTGYRDAIELEWR
jgi:ribosomal protein S18 acetylase RimI-like enzyme